MNSKMYDFLKDMDGMVVSYEVEMVKPDRGIYECLIKKYDIVPEEAVFLDDRKPNIEEARSLGLYGIVFENYEQARGELEKLLHNMM